MNRPFPTLRSWILPHLLTAPLILAGCADDSAGTGGGSPSGTGNGTSNGPGQGGSGGGANIDDVKQGACDAGATYDCKVYNAYGCLTGRQECVDGQWADCGLATAAPSADGERERERFGDRFPDGYPGDGVELRGGGIWETGALTDLSPAQLAEGIVEPCGGSDDCQFDHQCVAGSCVPWADGAGDPACVANDGFDVTAGITCEGTVPVCNRGSAPITADKLEDIQIKWETGSSDLENDCTTFGEDGICDVPDGVFPALPPGDCVNVACPAIPIGARLFVDGVIGDECACDNNWGYMIDAVCGAPVGGGATPEPCDGAGDISNNDCDPTCQGFSPPPPTFGGGFPADWGSGTFNNYPPSFLNAGLPNNCDEDPNENDCQFDHYCAPIGNGECVPWEPGEFDAGCAGPNVTIGLPCEDGIPVCNRGTVAVDTDDFHFDHESAPPVGSVTPADMNSGTDNIGNDPGGQNCDYEVVIQPGECEMIPFDCGTADPSDDFLPGQFITAHNVPGECNDTDNWGFYPPDGENVACGVVCDGSVSGTTPTPLTLFIALDISESMNRDLEDTGGTAFDEDSRLDLVVPALVSFVQDPASAGLGVVTRFFPSGDCGDDSCSAISPFVAPAAPPAGACAFAPCTAQADGAGLPLADGCSPEVSAVCALEPRCCGGEPGGTCASTPCAPSATPLTDNCNAIVDEVCRSSNEEFRRCCGLNEGACDRDPCVAQAAGVDMGDGTSCNNGGGTVGNNSGNGQILDVCNDAGYRYCCGIAQTGGTGAWNTNLSTARLCSGSTLAGGAQCRDSAGTVVNCSDASIGAAPVGVLAAELRAFCAIDNDAGALDTRTCCTNPAAPNPDNWSVACGTSFRSFWSGRHDGVNLCTAAGAFWNDDCRDHYISKDPDACDFQWDAACVTEYENQSDDENGNLGGEENFSCVKNWDTECVEQYSAMNDGVCTTGDACNRPTVPTGCVAEGTCPTVLPAGEADLVTAFTGITTVFNTPSLITMMGATDFCANFEAQRPGERCAVVFVTDGAPFGCNHPGGDQRDNATAIADQAYSSNGIFTFPIGIPGGDNVFMDEVAAAGGTGTAVIVPADGSSATAALLAALNGIRDAFSCSYNIDPVADLDAINVVWNEGSSPPPELTRVLGIDATNCIPCALPGNCTPAELQYYMPSGTEIVLCPDACATLETDPTSNIQVAVDCDAPPSGGTIQAFTADGACDSLPGTYPKWTVMYYDATIAGASSIAVNARTSIVAGGAMRSWHAVDMRPTTVAGLQNMTSAYLTSDLSDPPSLEDALAGEAFGEDLELEFVVDSTDGAPALNDYEVHFTCAFSE